ncbi:MAG: SPOR domain-containing protein [Allorhizobium sp.]
MNLAPLMGKFASLAATVLVALTLSAPMAHAAKSAGIVVDAKTGQMLYGEDPDGLRYPASLTKMMTLYLVFEALEAKRIRLDSAVSVSKHAASEPPSKLGVRAGSSFTVEQGILSLVTRSANDAATALGEFVGGSESNFARMMTAKARQLGMSRTTYRNANGLPNTAQMTTARDQARLGIALRQHFPQYYGYFSTRSFKYGKQVIGNHNRLLGAVRGVDGIKTGYTRAAGFNLVTSVEDNGRSIVGVVLGGRSGGSRDATMKKLVARYLPKATTSRSDNLIAKLRSAPSATPEIVADESVAVAASSSTILPASGPVPVVRYDPVTETAYAAPSAKSGAQTALEQVASIRVAPAAAMVLPRPSPAVTAAVQASAQKTAAKEPEIDETITASTTQASGWVVQIGVSPDKAMAMDLLRSAQDKGGKVLRSATPFTVAYSGGDGQLYRARFGGFDNQNAAVNTCKALKKMGIGCWAAMQ